MDFWRRLHTNSNSQDGGIVGAEGVQTYLQQNDPASDGLVTGLEYYNYFDAASGSLIPQLNNDGMRLTGGFTNADGSGLLLNAQFSGAETAVFDARAIALAGRMDTLTALQMQSSAGRPSGAAFNAGGRNDYDIVQNDILAPGVVFDSTDSDNYGFYGTTFDVLDRTVLNLYGMPILNGRSTASDERTERRNRSVRSSVHTEASTEHLWWIDGLGVLTDN
jgi:hypothetical protein